MQRTRHPHQGPVPRVVVEGHTDSIGSDTLDRRLGEARTEAAIAYPMATGVDPARPTGVGLGDQRPIASNDMGAGRASNGRVAFTFEQIGLPTG